MNDIDSELRTISHPQAQFTLTVPAEWEFDDSGSDDGLFIVQDPQAWGGRFHPNVVIVQRPNEPRHDSPDDYLQEQLALDEGLAAQLTDYRILHLGWDTLGADNTPAVLRVGSYMNEDGVALMLYQWSAIRNETEISFSVTFPTEYYPQWANPALLWSRGLEWTT